MYKYSRILSSRPSRNTPQHEKGEHFFVLFMSTPYLKEDFSDPATFSNFAHIPPVVTVWNLLQYQILGKFRLEFEFRVDKFVSLTSERRHM